MFKTTLVLLITPLLILFIFLPIYIFRLFVQLFCKIFKRNFSGILESRSTFLAVQDIYTNPKISLSVSGIIQGGISKESCIKELTSILTLSKGPHDPDLKYKHLREYLTPWMGFLFWAKDKEFNVLNHIKVMSLDNSGDLVEILDVKESTNLKKTISTQDLKNIENFLLRRPFTLNRSPWEFIIIPNFKPKFSPPDMKYDVGIFRIHHAMADGHSILKMWNCINLIDNYKENHVKNQQYKQPFTKFFKNNPFLNLYTTIRTPFDLIYQILFSKSDQNGFHLENGVLFGNSNFHLIETDKVPLGILKEIRKYFRVQFSSVICAGITSGFRNCMKNEGMEIPHSLTCTLPFPFPPHPDQMSNHWSAMTIELPMSLEDPVERLKLLDNQLTQLKRSIGPIISFKVQCWIGSLFYWMVKPLAGLTNPTGLISDFPGPSSQISQFGGNVSDLYFNLGFPIGRIGLIFTSMSYNGYWKMTISVDKAILPSQLKAEQFKDDIIKEFNNLHAQIPDKGREIT